MEVSRAFFQPRKTQTTAPTTSASAPRLASAGLRVRTHMPPPAPGARSARRRARRRPAGAALRHPIARAVLAATAAGAVLHQLFGRHRHALRDVAQRLLVLADLGAAGTQSGLAVVRAVAQSRIAHGLARLPDLAQRRVWGML